MPKSKHRTRVVKRKFRKMYTQKLKKQYGGGPLHDAASAGNVELVQQLLANGTNINLRDINGKTALFDAVENNHIPITQALLNAGINVNIQDNRGRTALFFAISEEMRNILSDAGATALTPDQEVESRRLREGRFIRTARAVLRNEDESLRLVQLLLADGVNVNIRDRDNETALMKAADRNKLGIAEALINAGANVNLHNDAGYTALVYARSTQMKILLIQSGAISPIIVRGEQEIVALLDPELFVKIPEMPDGRPDLALLAGIYRELNPELTEAQAQLKAAALALSPSMVQQLGLGILEQEDIDEARDPIIQQPIALALLQLRQERQEQQEQAQLALLAQLAQEQEEQAQQAPAQQQQLYPQGMAYEIHSSFASVNVPGFLEFMKNKVGDKNSEIPTVNTDVTNYIQMKLNSFVHENTEVIQPKLNALYIRHLRNASLSNPATYNPIQRSLFFYTLEYVSGRSVQFQQNYVSAFAVDCTEAYAGTGNIMSCARGVKERIVLSLETAIASEGELTDEYRELLHLLNPTKYPSTMATTVSEEEYMNLFKDYGSVCTQEGEISKEQFITCMKQKFQETLGTRYQEDAVLAKLNELISSQLGNNYFSSGGGKRTLRKKRNVCKSRKYRK